MSIHPAVVPIDLLPELVHKIFLHAAQSSTSSCRTLCEVSTWTRRIALPHLYTTVFTTSNATIIQFLSSVTTPPVLPPSATFCPLGFVQNLWITTVSDKLEILVQRCLNISRIVLYSYDLPWLLYAYSFLRPPATSGDREPDLDIMLRDYPQPGSSLHHYLQTMDSPLFDHITHLRLENHEPFRAQLQMRHMRRLTHLAMSCGSADVQDLACVLPVVQDTSIEVLALIMSSEYLTEDQCREVENWVRMIRTAEERIYVAKPLYDRLEREWEAEARGGATIWERAFEYTGLVMSRV